MINKEILKGLKLFHLPRLSEYKNIQFLKARARVFSFGLQHPYVTFFLKSTVPYDGSGWSFLLFVYFFVTPMFLPLLTSKLVGMAVLFVPVISRTWPLLLYAPVTIYPLQGEISKKNLS